MMDFVLQLFFRIVNNEDPYESEIFLSEFRSILTAARDNTLRFREHLARYT